MNIYEQRMVRVKVSKAKIRYLAELKGMSIKDLAKYARCSNSYLHNCLSEGTLPNWLCIEVCRVLGCQPEDLLD